MKTYKRIIAAVFVIVICLTSAPLGGFADLDLGTLNLFNISSFAANDSGTCGNNTKWKYDSKTKTLTIYGKGEMGDCHYDSDYVHGYYELLPKKVENVVISEGITYIGEYAFCVNGSTAIKSIKIANTVKSIGNDAFGGAAKLKKVTIPDSVKSMGFAVFDGCTSLEEVVIGNGVTEIDYIFGGCDKLVKVVIGKNVKKINIEGWCGSLFSVSKSNKYFSTDKNGVLYNKDKTKLYRYPDALKLETFIVPKGVKAISANAFSFCQTLKKVDATNIETIGAGAFRYSNIEEVVLGKKLKIIKDEAFSGCRNLKTVKIPASVTKIGEQAFYESADVAVDSNNKKFCSDEFGVLYNKNKTILISYPEKLDIKSYVIPDTVEKIAPIAFCGNDFIEEIEFPKGLKEIGERAIGFCYGLKSVCLYKDIELIGREAFARCNITELTIEEGSKAKICDEAFMNCSQLTDIYISSEITDVGCYNFENIGEYGGAYYTGNVLCNSYGGKSIAIKEGTIAIADEAFDCSDVESITIPSSVRYIGENAFANTKELKKITVAKGNKYFVVEDDTLFNKDKTRLIKYASKESNTEYTVPKTVKIIDNFAFCSAPKLKKISIGNNVTHINDTIFYGTAAFDKIKRDKIYYYGKNAIALYTDCITYGAIRIKDGTKGVFLYEDYYFVPNAVYIPKSVKTISELPYEVYYEGTEEEWNKINFIEDLSEYVDYLNVHFNFDVNSHKHVYYKGLKDTRKCFSPLLTIYTCPCGHYYTRETAIYNNHIYSGKENITKKATEKNNGVKYCVCDSCGKNYDKTAIARIASVKLSYKNTKYNGKVKKPKVTVQDSNGYKLYEGIDYTVKYQSGRKEVGTYAVTVVFKGNYSGTKKLKFNIVSA